MRRSRDGEDSYWAERLGEPGVTTVLNIEAGPPFVAEGLGLSGAALLLLVLGTFGLPSSPVFLVVCIVLFGASLLTGGCVVRRLVARRWIDVIGTRPPTSMLLGVVGDRLVIWRWPPRGQQPPDRLVDAPLADVALRPRAPHLGGLEIELPGGRTLLVNHSMGPSEREALARIRAAVTAGGVSC